MRQARLVWSPLLQSETEPKRPKKKKKEANPNGDSFGNVFGPMFLADLGMISLLAWFQSIELRHGPASPEKMQGEFWISRQPMALQPVYLHCRPAASCSLAAQSGHGLNVGGH